MRAAVCFNSEWGGEVKRRIGAALLVGSFLMCKGWAGDGMWHRADMSRSWEHSSCVAGIHKCGEPGKLRSWLR